MYKFYTLNIRICSNFRKKNHFVLELPSHVSVQHFFSYRSVLNELNCHCMIECIHAWWCQGREFFCSLLQFDFLEDSGR